MLVTRLFGQQRLAGRRDSRLYFADDVAMNVRQAVVAALEAEGEAAVVDAEAIEHRRVEIVHMDAAAGDVETVVVG